VTQDQTTFKAALREARDKFIKSDSELSQAEHRVLTLKDELVRLRRTITALAAMCSEDPRVDKLGITDACMEVMQEYPVTMSTNDVVGALESRGFDLASQKNAAASVHAVLSRLAKSGKITRVTDTKDDSVNWRGPNYSEAFESGLNDDDIPF
jgi:hypothetical protein